jgi:lipoprotein signal peptidase
MKIQLVFLIPQYVYLVIDQNWSRAQLYLRTVTEAILLTGCLITLRMDTSAFRSIYPELPDSLFSIFNLALWLIIIGILISVAVYWRRKAEVAFTRSSQQ